MSLSRGVIGLGIVTLAILCASCQEAALGGREAKKPEPAKEDVPGRKEIGPNVFFEKTGEKRRVLIHASVCLREGFLEHLLSRTQAQKQHESILTAEFDARHIHFALLAAGAKPGRPVQFVDDKGKEAFKPATGDKIKVTLEYEDKGKTIAVPAQRWIRDFKTKKDLAHDWVFAGSKLFPSPDKKEPFYGANDGRVICVSNFPTALLDLPIKSDEGDPNVALDYEGHTERIPPLKTKVTVVLEVMPKPAEKK